MIRRADPRLRAYVTAGIVGLIAALAVGSPATALIGVPMLMLVIIGLAGGAAPNVTVDIVSSPASMVEGEEGEVVIALGTDSPVARAYVDLDLEGLAVEAATGADRLGPSTVMVRGLTGTTTVNLTVAASTWGRRKLGPLRADVESTLGMSYVQYQGGERRWVTVVPAETTLRSLLAPLDTNLHVGDLVSRMRGTGSEFADLRQYRIGDDPRTLNWRVSSRARDLWVNERHPERNGDVVLLIDAQVESGTELEALVDRSVRMAAALLHAYGRRHHRLGIITLDGVSRWVEPGMGELHRRRLVEQLMGVTPGEVLWDAAERALLRAARRPSMVIALTPLMDVRLAGVIHSVRRGGVDVAIIELEVAPTLPPPAGEARSLGRRIWVMERERLRDRLAAAGIPVTTWRDVDPPDVPLSILDQWRTSWRRRLG